ncbi:alpha/beta-hydrolase [Xylariomycetidae sp. FL0641]|nr:alpha/beta-hydrolase [Xylariomycetidae sp. FL0641]
MADKPAQLDKQILAKYDPEVVDYVRKTRAAAQQQNFSIQEIRADPAKFAPPWARNVTGWERVADATVAAEDGHPVPVKIYHPDPERFGPGPYGAHLNFHGGGFVLGGLTFETQICLSMRDGAGVVVVDVDYRHCPEHLWGKCMQDGWATLLWVRKSSAALNVKPDSLSIGGISAGGHIALVLQHMARDAGIPLRLCLATVPPTTEGLQYRDYKESPYPSFHEFALGPILGWDRISFFGAQCFPRDDPAKFEEVRSMWPSWWYAPIHAENWSDLCPTFIRTAGCDPLRDEGEAYAVKLVAGGTKVTIKRYLGCPHTWMFFTWYAKKQEWDRDSIAALKEAHVGS